MHVEFVPDFCEGADPARLSCPVAQTSASRASDTAGRLYQELLHPDSTSRIVFEGLALVLVAETIREVGRDSKAPRWLRSVRDRLQEEYMVAPSLRQIAADVSVHPTYLATTFQKHFGVSVGEFFRLRRIAQARKILAQSDQSLSEVALLLGFSDQSHFCRTFKKQTGLSPLEFRRLFASNPNPIQ
jgi:AraC family transcriptional regulator